MALARKQHENSAEYAQQHIYRSQNAPSPLSRPTKRTRPADITPTPHPVHAGSRGTKRRCRGNFLPRRGKFLPRRGNFFPRHLLLDGRCAAWTRCHEEERGLREVFSSPHPFPTGTGTEKRRCYVKNFTYDVSFFTYDVIFFT